MRQMDIPQEMQVPLDYDQEGLSRPVRELRPVVWHDGTDFCCLLGPDPQEGIFGCGATAEAALTDWETHVKERIRDPRATDEVTQYVIDMLGTSKNDVW